MKGPKGVLAEAISKALAEYFVVDPTHVETNLTTHAGLTLHDVQLRPQEQSVNVNDDDDDKGVTARVQGSVSKVGFHWKWGGSSKEGGSSWVNSAELTIDGLKVTVVLTQPGEEEEEKEGRASGGSTTDAHKTDATSTTTSGRSDAKANHGGGFKGYVREQVERIIDTLRLSITDFDFRLQLPPTKDGHVRTLCFGGEGLSLESLGRSSEMDPLRQKLDIANIFSRLVVKSHGRTATDDDVDADEEAVVYPLLDPISYKAECVRTVGKRFQGGIQRGLTVRGESIDDGIVVHTGKEQISFWNDLGGLLIAPSPSANDTEETKVPESDAESSQPDECDMYSSFFQFPLAALSLVFPNGTKISMADLEVQYQMDGNVCLIQGRKGFLVNGFPLLALGEEGSWQANVVKSKFSVSDKAGDTTTVAKIHARDDEIQDVKSGVNDLLEIYQTMLSDTSGAIANMAAQDPLTAEATAPPTETASTSNWTFDIDGNMEFLFEGSDKETIMDCRLRKISAGMANKTLTVESVEKLDVPGSISLTQPLKDTKIQFDGKLFDIHLDDIVAKLEPPPVTQKPEDKPDEAEPILAPDDSSAPAGNETAAGESAPPFVLPFGAKAHINSVKIYETDGKSIHTTLKTIQAAIGPDLPKDEEGKPFHTGGVRALLMLEEVEHDMISLKDPKLTAVIYPQDLELAREFDFGASSIAVAAGYSVFDWKRLLETGDQKREKRKKAKAAKNKDKKQTDVRLPFAHVHPLKVKIAVKGDVVATKGTTMNINEFIGKENTVLRDLIRFYTACTMKNMPGMFRDADVLGFNVTDTAASHVGTAAGAGVLGALGGAAAPVAGVLGVVGLDGVKHTINAGKKSRGVAEDDKMAFGDFFRGIGQAAKDSTAAGATRRGKTAQDKSDAFDWALGATSDAAQYTNENKARLGGAGAGTAGFAYGMLLGGPVGGVAGALIASTATSRTIGAIDSRFSSKAKNKTAKS